MEVIKNMLSSKGTLLGLFGLGSCGSYLFYNYHTDQKLNHQLVKEAIKILEMEEEINKLIGFPLMYERSIFNKAIFEDNTAFLKFKVRGPRGIIDTELNGSAKSHKEIIDNKLDFLEFYIPEQDILNKFKEIEKYKDEKINENENFWKIEYLTAIQNDIIYIPIIPKKLKSKSIFNFCIKNRNTIGDLFEENSLRNKCFKNYDNLTNEEKEELYKIRLKESSMKTSYIRYSMFAFMLVSSFFVLNYLRINKNLSIKNIDIIDNAKKLLLKNKEFLELTKNEKIYFNETLLGHHNKKFANVNFQFYGKNFKGMILSDSKFDNINKEWKFEKISAIIEIKNEKKEINLFN